MTTSRYVVVLLVVAVLWVVDFVIVLSTGVDCGNACSTGAKVAGVLLWVLLAAVLAIAAAWAVAALRSRRS
jgi:hypothetical protein